jgi:hypothetical protein
MTLPYGPLRLSNRKSDERHIVALFGIGRELTEARPYPFVLLANRQSTRFAQDPGQPRPAEADPERIVRLGYENIARQIEAKTWAKLDIAG